MESHSAKKEDVLIYELIKHKLDKIYTDNPCYYDVGVNDPIIYNNTYLFYQLGFRGVLIEPLPFCHENIEKTRPNDVLVKGAAGTTNESGRIKKRGSHGGGSYITDPKWLGTKNCYPCQIYGINELIEQHGVPLFMSIDVEGMELLILNAMKKKVPCICLEHDKANAGDLLKYIQTTGYEIAHVTRDNVILTLKNAK
jgi:FkbM family methyltransferase